MGKKEELAGILDPKNISDDKKTLEAYSQDHSFAPRMQPALVVKPKSADEVQRIVKWANEKQTPLVPISSGPPHFRGDTIPDIDGAVIVDLQLMNRIIKINRRNRWAMVEPGVTWDQLQRELSKEGMWLPMPLLPRKTKSVLGSLLEREPTLTPHHHWTLMDPLRGLEIIWGNGDKLWSGSAGFSWGTLEEQWARGEDQLYPLGPGNIDFYRLVSGAQGTMGIVTWGVARCELLAKSKKLFFAPTDDLSNLLDFAYKRFRLRFGDEFLFLNRWNLACILGENASKIQTISKSLPAWVLIITVAGYDRLPEERVKFQEQETINLAKEYRVQLEQAISGVEPGKFGELLCKSSEEPYWKMRSKGSCQEIFFLTTLDKTPEFVKIINSAAETVGYPTSEIGIYIQPQMQGGCCHCEFDLYYDPGNAKEKAKVQELFLKGSEKIAMRGGYFSRPYGTWAKSAYGEDNMNTMAVRKVKAIFDPKNVMNPKKLCF